MLSRLPNRLHEVRESAALGWFPMPHKNPVEWILIHHCGRAEGWSVAARTSATGCARGAHSSRSHVIIQDHDGAVRGGVARLLSRLLVG